MGLGRDRQDIGFKMSKTDWLNIFVVEIELSYMYIDSDYCWRFIASHRLRQIPCEVGKDRNRN